MAEAQNARSESALQERLLKAIGGLDHFSRNWAWRSHSPKQRAESAILGGVESIGDGIAALIDKGATADQIEEWTAKAIRLWLAWQAAGARTANPMITGPANFPVARNQKANAAERKRGEEFYLFAHRPISWLDRRNRSAEKAALSAEAATIQHRTLEFPGVKLVQNTTLDRIQLLFEGKPEPDTIGQLKREAFRWSPREGAWQRQNTNNGVQAAYRVLRFLGHEKGSLSSHHPEVSHG
ncbi:hypothetical protein [Sphingobium baderi]|uniref:Uncharacterized protein n=1 Tax=Sphingobium baderi LL03 TaxID=1114964 RepID=T0GZU9_9SPHN|nr:hypothetical protein [Sphingobium baderi]EQB06247.1 hypothetical protein L485_01090 [Sphingobium baderi LL03]KMS62719.1 hypothetical protein V475_06570 [Sphingobium baderi LL03]